MSVPEELKETRPLRFEDLFDLEEIQGIQDRFAKTNGVSSVITRPDGTHITKPSNFHRLCTEIIRETGKGLKNCKKSAAALGKRNPSGPIILPCPGAGFLNGGACISIDGKHLANWLVGQVRNEAQSDEKMLAYAREIGADEKEFKRALDEVTVMSSAQFEGICNNLFLFANQLSRTAHHNYQRNRESAERRKAEAAHRVSEERFRQLFDTMEEGFATHEIICGADGRPVDYRFTDINPAFERLTGLKREDLVGRTVLEALPGTERVWIESYGRVALKGERLHMENYSKELGKWYEVSAFSPKPGEFAVSFIDVTERKRADSELRDAFEMQGVLNAMLQRSMTDGGLREKLGGHLASLFTLPWLAIQPKGAVFLMNPGGKELLLTAQQGMSEHVQRACAAVTLGRCLCGKAAETGRAVEAAEVGADHHITYAGIEPHGHCCTPISAGGRTLGVLNLYLKAGTVLTDKQRRFIKHVADIMAENILHSRTVSELTQAQKMESVGRLAGGIAHDFNNILTAIKCYAEFLLKALPPQDPKTDDVKEILTASDRAAALTRQLLAFSRRQIMAPKVADLNKCVTGIGNMLKHLIGEDITFSAKLAAEPCTALIDTGQLEQVLVNLVVNARDAMPGGGAIQLSTELLPASEALRLVHPALPRGPVVRVNVKDSGCGMTEEVKSHLFEPFFTTKEPGKGTGLGLSTVFGIVKQSGGDIEVRSEPGKGTVFSIYFPYSEPGPGGEAAGKGAQDSGGVNGRETILYVEDEESLRRLGKRILSAQGYTVLTAADGQEALKELERHGKPVDLLMTDVVMPGMSGRDLGQEVARRKMAARTIYMSGYTDDAIVSQGVLEPGLAFIYKPFTVESLSAKLREVLDGSADQARP